MRLASRSPFSGKPVSNSSDSPVGETKSVDAPPSTSIQVIFRSPDWAARVTPAASVNAATAAAERKRIGEAPPFAREANTSRTSSHRGQKRSEEHTSELQS